MNSGVTITDLAKEQFFRVARPKSPILTQPVVPVMKMLSHYIVVTDINLKLNFILKRRRWYLHVAVENGRRPRVEESLQYTAPEFEHLQIDLFEPSQMFFKKRRMKKNEKVMFCRLGIVTFRVFPTS